MTYSPMLSSLGAGRVAIPQNGQARTHRVAHVLAGKPVCICRSMRLPEHTLACAELRFAGDLGPFGDLGLEEGRKLIRRAADETIAEGHAARLDVGEREHALDIGVDL